jgi:hypothetical protein
MIFAFEHDQMWVSSFDQTVTRMTRDDCRLSLIPGAFVS